MGEIVVINHVTLDGVMQGPGRPEEDTRGGFAHGGWGAAGWHPRLAERMGERMGEDRAFLFGRRTYEGIRAAWAQRPGDPFGAALTDTRKYVTSRSGPVQAPAWANTEWLAGEAVETVAALKARTPSRLVVFGSGELIGALLSARLIDEFLLLIHPLLLGTGRRLFAAGQRLALRLESAEQVPSGVVLARYTPLAD